MKNIVDSSAWLEYFAGTKNAAHFSAPIEDSNNLIVPAIVVYEIFKKVLQEKGEAMALKIVAHLQLGQVIEIDLSTALKAAKLSQQWKLPMADSLILAVAQLYHAVLWTQDSDFKDIPGVKYFRKI